MAGEGEKLVRNLYGWEIEEFHPVFGDSLRYELVRVHENTPWPDLIDQWGRRLKRMPALESSSHNAITIGNNCIFPVSMPKVFVPVSDPENYKLDWLVHELTHAWQFQHMGWSYILKALQAQFAQKAQAYDYGGEDGLKKSMAKNMPFVKFNPEQQGNITQAYYIRLRAGQDTSAWDPFIKEMQKAVFV